MSGRKDGVASGLGYPGSAEPTSADESAVAVGLVVDAVVVVGAVGVLGASAVPVAEGGAVWLPVPVGVEGTVAELPVAGGVVGGAEVAGSVPVEVAEGVSLGDGAGVPVGVVVGNAGPV
ncbi:hypothetical protein [Streptomyces sp. YIM S03343]